MLKIKRKAIWLVPLAALFVAACGSDSGTASQDEPTTETADGAEGPSGDPVKIGFISSMAGPGASLGQEEHRGAELFEEYINAAGGVLGRPVELVVADDQSKADVVVTEAQKIIDEGVVAVVGPTITPTMLAVIPALKDAELPTVFMTPVDYPNLNEEPLLFSPVVASVQQGLSALVDYIDGEGVEKLGLVLGNDALGDNLESAAKPLAEDAGIELEIARVPLDSSDYTSVLAAQRDADVEAVFTGMTGPASAIVRKNQGQLGWDVPMYSHTGNISSAFLELLGPDAEGMAWYSTAAPVAEDLPAGEQKDLISEVFTAYEEKYGEGPSNYLAVGFAFDALLSVAHAIEAAESAEPADIRDALETQQIIGINGSAQRAADDHRGTRQEDVYVVEWRDDSYRLLGQ